MLARGVEVSYRRSGLVREVRAAYANSCAAAPPGDEWRLDEVFIRINGAIHYLGVRSTSTATCSTSWSSHARNALATRKFFAANCSRNCGTCRRVLVTDKLATTRLPRGDALGPTPAIEGSERSTKNSHQPPRQRERAMKTVHLARARATVLSTFSGISPHFRPRRHMLQRPTTRRSDGRPLHRLEQITGVATTAA